jgi:hypothetical protein
MIRFHSGNIPVSHRLTNMQDLLRRLLDALPLMEEWMDALRARHLEHSVAASQLGLRRLSDHFPARVLDQTRVVIATELPFPPIATYRLPEFETMARAPMAGITFGNVCFVRPNAPEGVHFHELVHVVQWEALGVSEFLLTYAVGLIRHGYAHSPLEAIAFELQDRFERLALRGFVDAEIARHAATAGDAVAARLRAQRLDIRGRVMRNEDS